MAQLCDTSDSTKPCELPSECMHSLCSDRSALPCHFDPSTQGDTGDDATVVTRGDKANHSFSRFTNYVKALLLRRAHDTGPPMQHVR